MKGLSNFTHIALIILIVTPIVFGSYIFLKEFTIELGIASGMLSLFIIGVVILPLLFIKFINVELLEKRPLMAFLLSSFFIIIGFISSLFIFYSELSIGMIAISSLLILPFVTKILQYHKEKKKKSRVFIKSILVKHDKIIEFYISLFFGMVLSYIFLFSIIPSHIVDVSFQHQLSKFSPGDFVSPPFFEIIKNNLVIVVIAFSFSVFYGAGSIFVLNYNASIIGAFYGFILRSFLYSMPISINIVSLIPHTFLEILAYLLASIAGGILAHGKKDYKDATTFFVLSILLIVIAGYFEV